MSLPKIKPEYRLKWLYLHLHRGQLFKLAIDEGGRVISPSLFDLSDALDKSEFIRFPTTYQNVPLFYFLRDRKNVETCSPALLCDLWGNEVAAVLSLPSEAMLETLHSVNNYLPMNDWRSFKEVTKVDIVHNELFYHISAKRLSPGESREKFVVGNDTVDMTEYGSDFDRIVAEHPMGHLFNGKDVSYTLYVDACAVLIDPRRILRVGSTANYAEVSRLFGFKDFRFSSMLARACILAIEEKGLSMPYYTSAIKKLLRTALKLRVDADDYTALTGELTEEWKESCDSISDNGCLGLRTLVKIQATPFEALGVDKPIGEKDSDVYNEDKAKRFYHKLINMWMRKLDSRWEDDEYTPTCFKEVV